MNDLTNSPELSSELSFPPAFLWRLAEATITGADYFREVLEALPAAIYTTDPAGRITYYNAAAARLWGCRPELGSASWCGSWKLFRPDGSALPHDQCPMALAIKEKRPIVGTEAIAERPDGTRVPFAPFPTPIFDASGMLVGAVNMLVDISDHKRAEEYALRLVSIVESSDDAIVSKGLDGVITSWNRGAERLFGYTAEEIIGKSITTVIPPERLDEETDIIRKLQNGERVDHFETVRRRKDGTLIDISLTISPVRNAEGKVIGASKIARDIGEAKRAREQQKLLLGEMKHRVRNTLATVQAIALQTMHSASTEERAAFSARLHALANAHDVLTKGWERANLRDIVDGALAPFQEKHRERFLVEGPNDILVDANQSLLLAMALHELATNATKYGALSNRSGRIRLSWELSATVPVPRLNLCWLERGGPPVKPPDHKGFGSRLIERALGQSGDAVFRFESQGLSCTLELAL